MPILRSASTRSRMRPQLDFIHEFVPGSSERTLLLLHGTGGNERDLIPLGRELDSSAALLSPRGRVLEDGIPRFFRRRAEGMFDLEDLKKRTNELADFVAAATKHYKLAADQVVTIGYSNGANIAASMLLLRPAILRAAMLFRAMVPLVPYFEPPARNCSIHLQPECARYKPKDPSQALSGAIRQLTLYLVIKDVKSFNEPGGCYGNQNCSSLKWRLPFNALAYSSLLR